MPAPGTASGNFTEGSSALRVLYKGTLNTVSATLSTDGFTQTNPPVVSTTGTISQAAMMNRNRLGVLGGSVCFARPDAGNGMVGGPKESASPTYVRTLIVPLGLFVNDAVGVPYENRPAVASGQAPYTSSMGTYGSRLYETQVLDATNVAGHSTGDAIVYVSGVGLIASRNGYLMPRLVPNGGAMTSLDQVETAAQSANAAVANSSTVIGILKLVADSAFAEIILDQRI